MKTLFKKELQFYLNNPLGYITLVLFGVFANFMFVKDIFVYGSASMRPFFEILPWLFMIFIPAVSMRLFAEERRTNTMETLLSLPISEMQIVIAKFLATLVVTAIGLILTLGLPISMYALTQQAGSRIYLPEIFVGYMGQLLLASGFIAISMFFSVKTKNQIIAFLGSVIILFFLIIFSTDFAAGTLPQFLQGIFNYLSPTTQVDNFIKGVLDIRSMYYFVSITVLFIFLTVVDLEKRP
ncbi:MAG: ABC transporter permease subunit [Candidatus Roizmanbacteria bacterium]|nr:ABC transporter permease subunit [Candidatus Roizmanbacteria bacterium]